jgi:hypothetical protein
MLIYFLYFEVAPCYMAITGKNKLNLAYLVTWQQQEGGEKKS